MISQIIYLIGRIYELNINHKYENLDLSRVECEKIYYENQ